MKTNTNCDAFKELYQLSLSPYALCYIMLRVQNIDITHNHIPTYIK